MIFNPYHRKDDYATDATSTRRVRVKAAPTRPDAIGGSYSCFPSVPDAATQPTTSPTRVQSKARHHRRRTPTSGKSASIQPPRPPNSFFLFRTHYYRIVVKLRLLSNSALHIKQQQMSQDLGCVWQGMSADERAPFQAEALCRRKEYLVQMALLANPGRHSRPLILPSVPLVNAPIASNPLQGVIPDYTLSTSFDSSPTVAGPSSSFTATLAPTQLVFCPVTTGVLGQTFAPSQQCTTYPQLCAVAPPVFPWSPIEAGNLDLDALFPPSNLDPSNYPMDDGMADVGTWSRGCAWLHRLRGSSGRI